MFESLVVLLVGLLLYHFMCRFICGYDTQIVAFLEFGVEIGLVDCRVLGRRGCFFGSSTMLGFGVRRWIL